MDLTSVTYFKKYLTDILIHFYYTKKIFLTYELTFFNMLLSNAVFCLFILVFVFGFQDRVSLGSPGCPGTSFVD